MQKYKYSALADVMTVKVGTKYVWEERVRQQSTLVHMLEDVYGINLNIRALSFYPNNIYFGVPITNHPNFEGSVDLWTKIDRLFSGHRWKIYSSFKHPHPALEIPKSFHSFEDLGFDHVQVLLSELVLFDLNYPSIGLGQLMELSLFQPLIGFSKSYVTRMATGRPGSLILKYSTDDELLNMLSDISKRKNYQTEPFYQKKSRLKSSKSVYKGKICLNEVFSKNVW